MCDLLGSEGVPSGGGRAGEALGIETLEHPLVTEVDVAVVGDGALGVHPLLVVRLLQQRIEPSHRELPVLGLSEDATADEQRFVLMQGMVRMAEIARVSEVIRVVADGLFEPSEVLGAVIPKER